MLRCGKQIILCAEIRLGSIFSFIVLIVMTLLMCMDFEIDIMQKFLGEVRGFSLFVLVSILPVGIEKIPDFPPYIAL